jgi:hypothetical protein
MIQKCRKGIEKREDREARGARKKGYIEKRGQR